MEKQLFEELLESVREAKAIMRGKMKLTRIFIYDKPNIKGIRRRFKIVLENRDEGGYTVYVPSLPGCISEGETIEEALANIREAIELCLEPVEDDWNSEENRSKLECMNAEIGIGLEQAERGELIDASEIKFDDLLSEAKKMRR